MKIVGQVEEAEDSCPIRGEADVESCCLDIRESRGEHSLEIQICRKPSFIISAAHRTRNLIFLSREKHCTVLLCSQCITVVFEPFIYFFLLYYAVSYD